MNDALAVARGPARRRLNAAAAEPRMANSESDEPQASPAAAEEARICFSFANRGNCSFGARCRFRHLSQTHPDTVADRMRTGVYDEVPAPPKPRVEHTQQAAPGELGICFTYLNRGTCRPDCPFRHLHLGHPAMQPGQPSGGTNHARGGWGPLHSNQTAPQQGQPTPLLQQGPMQNLAPQQPMQDSQYQPPFPSQDLAQQMLQNLALQQPMQTSLYQQPFPPQGLARQMLQNLAPQQPTQDPLYQQPFSPQGLARQMLQNLAPQQPIQNPQYHRANPPQGLARALQRDPGGTAPEKRLCFPFMNKGRCERADACRFRHLSPDHPDAVADRMRTGRDSAGPGRQDRYGP